MKEDLDDILQEDERSLNIDFAKYRRILKRHWKTIMWWGIGGFVVGCIFALATPRKFTCTSKLAPELSSTATSRLSGMASLIGFSSSVLGTTDAVYPMVYPELVHSPEFIVDLFDMPVDFVDKKDSVHTTLYDYMENYCGKTVVGDIVFAPVNLLGKLMEYIDSDVEEEDSVAVFNSFNMTRKQGMIYKQLCKCIDAEIDKKTLVVTITTSLDNRYICADLSSAVNDNIKKYVTRYRTEKTIHDRDYYQKMYDDSKREYFAALDSYSRYVDSHQGVVLLSANADMERLKNEANLKFQLYSSMAQQLQTANAKVQQETPVFAEVITPTVPFQSVNSRKTKALGFAFLALCAGAVSVLIKGRKEEKNERDVRES